MSTIASIARDLKRSQARSLKNRQTTTALLQRYANTRSRTALGAGTERKEESVDIDDGNDEEPSDLPAPVSVTPPVTKNRRTIQRQEKFQQAPVPPQVSVSERRAHRERAQAELQNVYSQWQALQTTKAQLVRQERKLIKKMEELGVEIQDTESEEEEDNVPDHPQQYDDNEEEPEEDEVTEPPPPPPQPPVRRQRKRVPPVQPLSEQPNVRPLSNRPVPISIPSTSASGLKPKPRPPPSNSWLSW